MARIVFVLIVCVTWVYAQPHPVCGDACGCGTQPKGSGVQTQTFLFFRTWTRTSPLSPAEVGAKVAEGIKPLPSRYILTPTKSTPRVA
jgi:hypothetical protein